MLLPLRYVFLDLETTGTDHNKDEIIQIWLIEVNQNLEVVKSFESLVKPQQQEQLKDIVHFLTWLKLQDLQKAPSMEELKDAVSEYFDENTVIIWHNIDFDIQFLQKHFSFPFKYKIDTFPLARTLMHFASSYSLEVLDAMVPADTIEFQQGAWGYHNALFDCYTALRLFSHLAKSTRNLIKKYPIISNYLKRTTISFASVLNLNDYGYKEEPITLFLPALQKEIKAEKRFIFQHKNQLQEQSWTKFFIADSPLRDIFKEIMSNTQPVIISFGSYAKLDIAKKIFKQLWLQNIGSLYDEYIFNQDICNRFLHKKQFDEVEISFILKYYSQFDKGHSYLDINQPAEKKILSALTQAKEKTPQRITLATHQELYEKVALDSIDKDTYICFFDSDYWYATYARFLNQSYSPYQTIDILETLDYVHQLRYWKSLLAPFISFFCTFTGVLFVELAHQFKNVALDKIEINPISGNISFHKTNLLLRQFDEHLGNLKKQLEEEDFAIVNNQIQTLFSRLEEVVNVERKLEANELMHFTFVSSNNLVSYFDFADQFKAYHHFFFSNADSQKAVIWKLDVQKFYKKAKITKINSVKELKADHLSNKVFMLCWQKAHAKELFEYLIQSWLHQKYSVHAENISWWIGKILHATQWASKVILCGWFDTLLRWIWMQNNYDEVYLYRTSWALETLFIKDILYWSWQLDE